MTVFWLYLKWFPQDNSDNIITPARVVDREHCVQLILHIFLKKKMFKNLGVAPKLYPCYTKWLTTE